MRCVTAITLLLLLPVSAFARQRKEPEQHKRYSPNAKFFIDFNPKTNIHTVFASDAPDDPRWSLKSDALWPYKHDESDGCLFLADDALSVAGLTWVHWEGKPPDYRQFNGLEFWRSDGTKTDYQISRLPSGRIAVIDFPVRIVWHAIHGSNYRGGNMTRDGGKLHVATFGMRSFVFSLQSGQITGWQLNADYFAYFALVYALPVSFLVRRIVRRWHSSAVIEIQQKDSRRNILIKHLGSLLVGLNSLGFAFGVFLDSFGGTIDRIGAMFCRTTYPIAFILIPVTLVISAVGLTSRPRRCDILGPWLAVMSVLIIVAIIHPY